MRTHGVQSSVFELLKKKTKKKSKNRGKKQNLKNFKKNVNSYKTMNIDNNQNNYTFYIYMRQYTPLYLCRINVSLRIKKDVLYFFLPRKSLFFFFNF